MKFLYLTFIVSSIVTACVKSTGKPDITFAKSREDMVINESENKNNNNALNVQENIEKIKNFLIQL